MQCRVHLVDKERDGLVLDDGMLTGARTVILTGRPGKAPVAKPADKELRR